MYVCVNLHTHTPTLISLLTERGAVLAENPRHGFFYILSIPCIFLEGIPSRTAIKSQITSVYTDLFHDFLVVLPSCVKLMRIHALDLASTRSVIFNVHSTKISFYLMLLLVDPVSGKFRRICFILQSLTLTQSPWKSKYVHECMLFLFLSVGECG